MSPVFLPLGGPSTAARRVETSFIPLPYCDMGTNTVWPYMIHGSANALFLSRNAAVHCRLCLGVLCGGCGESRSSSLRSTMAAPGGDVSVGGRGW